MPAEDLYEYNPDEVGIAVSAIPIFSGWADGEFIKIEPQADDWEEVVGTDGATSRSRGTNRNCVVVIKLLSTSPHNAQLEALRILDKNTPGGAGVGSCSIRNGAGSLLHQSAKSWIKKGPDYSYDRKATVREWRIYAVNMEHRYG